uniref:FluG domain-containing protein n=1 Tax=Coccidioides posadasii RMSCC 3488 TaxID=454284 RepID=A0A0J6FSG3_COCPO|nr:hypothetical protein CPAG_09597 [Coccidioides posadasii RMSCC 3488]
MCGLSRYPLPCILVIALLALRSTSCQTCAQLEGQSPIPAPTSTLIFKSKPTTFGGRGCAPVLAEGPFWLLFLNVATGPFFPDRTANLKRSHYREKKIPLLRPEDYYSRDAARVAKSLTIRKKYAYATTMAINRVQRFWDRLLYKQVTGEKLDDIVGEQISEFILGPLTDEYNLDLSVKSKPTMSVEDLLSILHYHWCLDTSPVPHERYTVQLPLLMLMTAYTSSRPGALIESGCARGSNDALRYRDVVLRVIPNPEQPDRHVLVMEVTLMYMKGKRNKSQPTTYIFHERDDNLALCAISHFLALALADQAFEAQGINSSNDIFQIAVPPYRNSLQLRWKPDILDVPVFRRTIRTAQGIRVSPDRALPYDVFNQYLQRLGRNAGLEDPLTPYCIRRGTANAVDDVATAAERNQVLGHSRADIFERYYISQKVKWDVQSTYLGCPARDSVIRAVGMMSLTQDPRVPKDLADEQKAAIEQDPYLVELNRQRQDLVSAMKLESGSVSKAQGTDLHAQHRALEKTIQSERRLLRRQAREETREHFFATIDTIEIEHQLLGLSVADHLKIKDASEVQFAFVERARLAQSLFQSLGSCVNEKHDHSHRVQAISDWTSLCHLQGVSYRKNACGLIKEEPDLMNSDTYPLICPPTQCLFCLGNDQLAYKARNYSFSRPQKAYA